METFEFCKKRSNVEQTARVGKFSCLVPRVNLNLTIRWNQTIGSTLAKLGDEKNFDSAKHLFRLLGIRNILLLRRHISRFIDDHFFSWYFDALRLQTIKIYQSSSKVVTRSSHQQLLCSNLDS